MMSLARLLAADHLRSFRLTAEVLLSIVFVGFVLSSHVREPETALQFLAGFAILLALVTTLLVASDAATARALYSTIHVGGRGRYVGAVVIATVAVDVAFLAVSAAPIMMMARGPLVQAPARLGLIVLMVVTTVLLSLPFSRLFAHRWAGVGAAFVVLYVVFGDPSAIGGPVGQVLRAVQPALPPFRDALWALGNRISSALYPRLGVFFAAWSLALFTASAMVFRWRDLVLDD